MQVLFVSYAYPPMGAVGAMRISRLCRYLPDYGINPVVLTVKEPLADGSNSTIPFVSHVRVERAGMLTTPLDLYRRWRTQVGSSHMSSNSSSSSTFTRKSIFRRHLLSLLQIPDMYWGWYWPAVWTAKKLMERAQFSAILSSGPPWTCHLIARSIKKKYHLPWIADFRDAWTLDPWRYQKYGGAPQWRENIDRRLESSCLRAADLVVCTTDAIRRCFVVANPGLRSSKFVTLTNGVDDRIQLPTLPQPPGARRLLLHLGSLYGGSRRIDTFCQAMADLVSTGKLDAASFKVLFVGMEEADSAIAATVARIAPELVKNRSLEFLPRVSWSEGQQVMMEAHVLLIFQGDHTLSVPAKFFEYLQTGKPILAIVKKGALSEMIESTASGIWVEPSVSVKIAAAVMQILERPPRSSEEIQPFLQQYRGPFLAERLAVWIRELTSDPHPSPRT